MAFSGCGQSARPPLGHGMVWVMKKLVAAVLVLSLAGCGIGRSKLNPLNWFSKSRSEPVATTAVTSGQVPDPALSDTRPLVVQVTDMVLEPSSGGMILRATGLAPGPGYWGAELVPLNGEKPVNGVLSYFFRVSAPAAGTLPSPQRVSAARFLSNAIVQDARSIVVRGQSNQRRVARPAQAQ